MQEQVKQSLLRPSQAALGGQGCWGVEAAHPLKVHIFEQPHKHFSFCFTKETPVVLRSLYSPSPKENVLQGKNSQSWRAHVLRPGPGRLQLQTFSDRASLPPGSTSAEALKWPAVFLTCFFSYLPAKQRLSRTSTGFLAPFVAVQSPEATSGWQHPTELCQPASRWSPPKGPWTAPTSLRLRPQMAILPGLTQALKVSGPGQSRRG